MPRTYLLLLKLQAERTQDLADVQRLLCSTSDAKRAAMIIWIYSCMYESFTQWQRTICVCGNLYLRTKLYKYTVSCGMNKNTYLRSDMQIGCPRAIDRKCIGEGGVW